MPETIRVLYVAHGHPDHAAGGGELAAYQMYRAAATNPRYDASFLAAVRPHATELRAGSKLLQDESDPNTQFYVFDGQGFDDYFLTGGDLEPLRDYVLALRPDVIHLHHYLHFGIDLLTFLRRLLPAVRLVLTLHEFLPVCARRGAMVKAEGNRLCDRATALECARCVPERPAVDAALRRRTFAHHLSVVDWFLAPSRFLRLRLVEWGLPADRVEVLENGRPSWPPRPSPRPARAPGEPFVVAFLGQITFLKGAEVLLEAAAEYLRRGGVGAGLPPLRFVVHGAIQPMPETPDLPRRIRELSEKCGEVVRLHGRYSHDRVPALLAGAHCVVVPSIWWENAPMVIQEAFLAGLPVVCSNVGGMAEKVADGVDGLHFAVGDPHDLLQKLLDLAGDPDLYARLAAGIRPAFSDREMVARLDAIYDRLLAASPVAA